VVERVGVQRLHDGNLVHHLRQMRQQLGKLRSTLAVPGELELRPQELAVGIDERRPIPLEQLRRRQLAIHPQRQLRLVVEHLQGLRRTGHEEINHPLRLPVQSAGCLGAMGSGEGGRGGKLIARPTHSAEQRLKRPIAPSPTPHSLKNQRRAGEIEFGIWDFGFGI